MLRLYNTLTREKAEFRPIDPDNVRMYVCGPTVYDFAHIGNARPVIVFDVLFRLLRHIYGETHVTYVRNITDVDDKINARAAERYPDLAPEAGIRKLTEETAAQFHKDIAALGVLPPTVEPRATEHIAEMVQLCDALVKNGHAYVAADHVLFDVSSMPDYGRLSNRSLEEMEAGARVEVAPYKKGPMDFVLWKPSKPGEPGWASPAGIAVKGRPGWHIECSAMSWKHLGQVFDIHGGGIDLTFPHHENEIAQSRCAHETPVMANVWMHNGFLQVEGEKMSKSLGNFITIRQLYRGWRGQYWNGIICRTAMLKTHYRQPIDWSPSRLAEAKTDLNKFVGALSSITDNLSDIPAGIEAETIVELLSDDLNTVSAFAELHRLADASIKGNREAGQKLAWGIRFLGLFDVKRPLATLGGIHFEDDVSIEQTVAAAGLGEAANVALLTDDHDWLAQIEQQLVQLGLRLEFDLPRSGGRVTLANLSDGRTTSKPDAIAALITARLEARKRKDFKESDRIRDELAKMGIALKDTKNKDTGEFETTWEVAISASANQELSPLGQTATATTQKKQ